MSVPTKLEAFEFVEDKIQQEFYAAILKALELMGPDVQGVSWFCSTSASYHKTVRKAA